MQNRQTTDDHDESDQAAEHRLARLEACAAIRDVKIRSLLAIDEAVTKGGDPSAVQHYLTPGYRWRATPFGTVDGSQAYVKFVRDLSQRLSYTMQFLSGPAIDLDLDSGEATGKWALWQPLTRDNESWILMGHSEDRFVRDGMRWLLAGTDLDVEVLAPWRSNWGAEPVSARWSW